MKTRGPRIDAAEKNLQNSLNFAVRTWDTAIGRVDRHSAQCPRCRKQVLPHRFAVDTATLTDPKTEAYKLCGVAVRLEAAEVAARAEYLKRGGKLPVER